MTTFLTFCSTSALAPASTPANVSAKLNTAINEGLRCDEMQASIRRLGAEPRIMASAEFSAF